MTTMASQINSLTIVYSAVYSGADQRKHQSSASLAFVRGIHRGPVNSPHKWPVTRKMLPFDDVIMILWHTVTAIGLATKASAGYSRRQNIQVSEETWRWNLYCLKFNPLYIAVDWDNGLASQIMGQILCLSWAFLVSTTECLLCIWGLILAP